MLFILIQSLKNVLFQNATLFLHQCRIAAANFKLNPIDLFTGVKPDS